MYSEQALTKPAPAIGYVRAVIGLGQGLALYYLYRQAALREWPATDAYAFAPLLLNTIYLPLIALLGIGAMRLRTLLAFVFVAGVAMAALAYYDIWRTA